MTNEIIEKNLERIKKMLNELEGYLSAPFEEFKKDQILISASERKFQLIVDLASDINAQILIVEKQETPDTYRRSFTDLTKIGIIADDLAKTLATGAGLRNILVHEYDFEEDYEKFYNSAKAIIPFLKDYVKIIYVYITRQNFNR